MTDKETTVCLSVSQGRHPIGPDALERHRQEEGMNIALYIAAALIMAVGSLYFAWRNRVFRKFLAGAAFCSISISPIFRCLCWGQVLAKHIRSAVAAPSSISSSSCSVSILASSGSQRFETDAIPYTQAVVVLHGSPAATRVLGGSRLRPARDGWLRTCEPSRGRHGIIRPL
jgi:hypothetical protein